MKAIFIRVCNILAGLCMIALSLFVQMMLFSILSLIVLPMVLPGLNRTVSLISLFVLFNGVACYEYFRKRRVVALRATVDDWKGIAMPDSRHTSMVIFLVPRGIDRIITGREFTG